MAEKKAHPISGFNLNFQVEIQVSSDGFLATRNDDPKGLNPAVVSTTPLTRQRNHFRIQIQELLVDFQVEKTVGNGWESEFATKDSKL